MSHLEKKYVFPLLLPVLVAALVAFVCGPAGAAALRGPDRI